MGLLVSNCANPCVCSAPGPACDQWQSGENSLIIDNPSAGHFQWQWQPINPITPATYCSPSVQLQIDQAVQSTGPFVIWKVAASNQIQDISWQLSVIYDGVQILTDGDVAEVQANTSNVSLELSPTNWQWDPTLPSMWFYNYAGFVSLASSPKIIEDWVVTGGQIIGAQGLSAILYHTT